MATLASEEFVGFDQRQRQAAEALDMLAELGRSSGKLYDLRRAQDGVLVALYNPKLAVKAVAVLANMNSVQGQQARGDVASRAIQPLALRQAAAKAFCENTAKYGIRLTAEELRHQYDRYNESEKQDAATRQLLGEMLDCIEAPTKQKK